MKRYVSYSNDSNGGRDICDHGRAEQGRTASKQPRRRLECQPLRGPMTVVVALSRLRLS
jgi:hypothetical protein